MKKTVTLLIAAAFACSGLFAANPADTVYVKARNPFLHQWIMYPCKTLESEGFARLKKDRVNAFGSLAKGTKFSRTGFFHTEKCGGAWVIVDPEGKLHIEAPLNHVQPGKGETQKAAFKSKFGTMDQWRAETPRTLFSLGFNGCGSWSDMGMIHSFNKSSADRKCTYYIFLSLMSGYARQKGVARVLPGHTGFPGDAVLVFDPGFEDYCEKKISEVASKVSGDPCLVGYFSDNELPFGLKNLEGYLSLPEDDWGHIAAQKWLRDKGLAVSDIDDAVRHEFAGYVADAYYGLVSKILRKYDRNHMYVGSRLHGNVVRIPEVVAAAGRYADILTVNFYSDWQVPEELRHNWAEWSGKPYMITEFYTKGEDSGLPNTRGAGWRVPTQTDRGRHYVNFCLTLLSDPNCVGWHLFKYQDNDPTDTTTDPSNRDSNKGIVNNSYGLYDDFTSQVRDLNVRRYAIWKKMRRRN